MNISIPKKTILAILAVAVIIAAGGLFYKKMQSEKDKYSVVYLATGEIYVGKLSTFPRLKLNNAYILQTVKDANDAAKSNLQLLPLSEAAWAPQTLNLNEKSVVFYGILSDDSKAAEAIRNKK